MGRCTGGNKALSDFVIIDEGPEDEPNRRTDEMSARLTAMIALLAGVLMIFSIACETAPASPAPTPPVPTPAVPTPANPSPTPADPADQPHPDAGRPGDPRS